MPRPPTAVMSKVADFFEIDIDWACSLFLASGYAGSVGLAGSLMTEYMPTPAHVIATLEVLLMEERAHEPAEEWDGLAKARELEDA